MIKFLQRILQLFFSPARGWEDVSQAGTDTTELSHRRLYPMMGIAALCCIIRLIYKDPDYTLIEALQLAIITFTVYFATLFLADNGFATFIKSMAGNANSAKKNQTFIIYCIGQLLVINIIALLIPVDLVIVQILPLYVIFVMYKGVRYLDVNSDHIGQFMFLSVFSICVPPFLLSFLFKILMPGT